MGQRPIAQKRGGLFVQFFVSHLFVLALVLVGMALCLGLALAGFGRVIRLLGEWVEKMGVNGTWKS